LATSFRSFFFFRYWFIPPPPTSRTGRSLFALTRSTTSRVSYFLSSSIPLFLFLLWVCAW
jgi:hypothetical protein